MKTISARSILVITALALIVTLFGAAGLSATAQGEIKPQTPTLFPSPTNNGGKAEWTTEPHTFVSNYPRGGTFAIKGNSSGGKITSASVLYYNNPSSRKRLSAEFDEASETWQAVWSTGGLPQWAGIWHWWQLTDEAGNVYFTDILYNEYEDTRREWKRLESDDIVVFWEATLPEDMGEEIVKAMADQREFYFRNWGALLRYKPRAIIYDDYEAVDEWAPGTSVRQPGIGGGPTTRIGGFTREEYGAFVGIFLKDIERTRRFAYGTVLHEIAHLYQYQNGGSFSEAWFIEGNAEYFALDNRQGKLRTARTYARNGDLPPLSEIGTNARVAYDVGFAFWVWFTETYGEEAHFKVWQLIGQGNPGLRSFETVTGRKFVDLETEFRAWLGAPNAVPPTVAPTETVFFFPSPTPRPTKTPKP